MSDEMGVAKPDPAYYARVLELLGRPGSIVGRPCRRPGGQRRPARRRGGAPFDLDPPGAVGQDPALPAGSSTRPLVIDSLAELPRGSNGPSDPCPARRHRSRLAGGPDRARIAGRGGDCAGGARFSVIWTRFRPWMTWRRSCSSSSSCWPPPRSATSCSSGLASRRWWGDPRRGHRRPGAAGLVPGHAETELFAQIGAVLLLFEGGGSTPGSATWCGWGARRHGGGPRRGAAVHRWVRGCDRHGLLAGGQRLPGRGAHRDLGRHHLAGAGPARCAEDRLGADRPRRGGHRRRPGHAHRGRGGRHGQRRRGCGRHPAHPGGGRGVHRHRPGGGAGSSRVARRSSPSRGSRSRHSFRG